MKEKGNKIENRWKKDNEGEKERKKKKEIEKEGEKKGGKQCKRKWMQMKEWMNE